MYVIHIHADVPYVSLILISCLIHISRACSLKMLPRLPTLMSPLAEKKKKHLHAACGGASSWVNNPPRNGDGAPVMTYIKKKYVTKRKPRTI